MSKQTTANAVIYLRVSTKEQAHKGGEAEGYSIPAQRTACKRKAESLGAHVVDEFVDAGESAKTSARPQLQAMLKRLAEGDIQYVIVHKVDRLARNRFDDVTINALIIENGAQLVSVSENIDETPSGNLMHGIMSSIAEFYSKNLANEVIKGMQQKIRSGGTAYMAPIGYLNLTQTIDGRVIKTVVVDSKRAPLIRWAYEMYATGEYGLNALTDMLEAKGFTNRPGLGKPEQPIRTNQLHRILQNRYYIGKLTWKGVEYEGNHPRLVDEQLFNKVQAMLRSRANSSERSYRTTHYLKGSLICGHCYSKITYAVSSNQRGVKYPYFFCIGRHEKRTECDFPYIAPELIEKEINKHYAKHNPLHKKDMPELKRQLLIDLEVYAKQGHKESVKLDKRIKRLQAERYRWADKAMAGTIPDDIAREKQTSLTKQLNQAQSEMGKYRIKIKKIRPTFERVCDLAMNLGKVYLKGGGAIRRIINQTFYEGFEISLANREVVTIPQSTTMLEALRTAEITHANSLSHALQKEEKRRDVFGVYSVIDNSRVPTVVIPRRIELRLPG